MERDPPSWHPATPATKALCKQAAALCREEGVDLAKLALHFCLREERVATTLISSTSLTRMHYAWVDTRAAQASPSWCSGGLSLSQRQVTPQAAPSFGQPRPISRLGRAGRPSHRPCSHRPCSHRSCSHRPCSSTKALQPRCLTLTLTQALQPRRGPAEPERQGGGHPREAAE